MILHCGEAIIDMILENTGNYRPIAGGSPLNTAITTARLGCRSALFSSISNDHFGKIIRKYMCSNGVDTTWLKETELPTTLAFAHFDAERNAEYSFYIQSTSITAITPDAHMNVSGIDCLQFGSISLLVESNASAILDLVNNTPAGTVRSFDPNIRETMIPTDHRESARSSLRELAMISHIVKLNTDELLWLMPDYTEEKAISHLLSGTPELLCLTRDKNGASLYTGKREQHVQAPAVEVADTVGAGDALHGGLLAWLEKHAAMSPTDIAELSDSKLTELLTFAIQVAGITCTRKGANPPTLSEFMAERKSMQVHRAQNA